MLTVNLFGVTFILLPMVRYPYLHNRRSLSPHHLVSSPIQLFNTQKLEGLWHWPCILSRELMHYIYKYIYKPLHANDWWSELLMLQTSYYARKGHRNLFASTTALLHTHFEYLFFWETFQAHTERKNGVNLKMESF